MDHSTYSVADLLYKWERGQLTSEQAIGHLLQHIATLSDRVSALEKQRHPPEQPPLPAK